MIRTPLKKPISDSVMAGLTRHPLGLRGDWLRRDKQGAGQARNDVSVTDLFFRDSRNVSRYIISSRVKLIEAVCPYYDDLGGGIVKYSKRALILPAAAVCLLSFGGCYTRLMSYQGEVTEAGSNSGCGECRDEVPYTGSRQVCVWERDFFGYPELRCYTTSYTSSWLYFHNTPWWYRSSYGWRDTRGCPPYYYYDRFSGTCRYYGGGSYSRPNTGTGGGGGGGSTVGSSGPRPMGRGAASAAEPPEPEGSGLAPMFSGSANKSLSPVSTPVSSSSYSPPTNASSAGMSKPHNGEEKPSDPPAEQKPAEQSPAEKRQGGDRRDRPHPSGRGR